MQRRGEAYELISNGVYLMSTHNGESERLLVTLALDAAQDQHRVLIGGLGVGFSLRAALADPRVTQVTVVEIEEAIIAWNRSHLAPFSGYGLSDPRTRIVHTDLVQWIQETDNQYDVICLDIDNGPEWTVTDQNGSLYGSDGLRALRRLMAPGGVVSFWSASAVPAFEGLLRQYFTDVRAVDVAVARGEPDYVYLCTA